MTATDSSQNGNGYGLHYPDEYNQQHFQQPKTKSRQYQIHHGFQMSKDDADDEQMVPQRRRVVRARPPKHQKRFQNKSSTDETNELESCIRSCEQLYQSFDDSYSGLLSDAELRLQESGETAKFQNMEKLLKKHVTQWYKLSRQISQIAISARGQMNHVQVQMHTLNEEIAERDRIIKSERKEKQATIKEYENQLKTLETVIANSLPTNIRTKQVEQWINEATRQPGQKKQKPESRKESEEWLRLKHDHNKALREMSIIKKNWNASTHQNELLGLSSQLATKENAILELRFLTQDLAQERNELEIQLKQLKKDSNFVSVTPSRQMKYELDLTSFLSDDDNQDEKDGSDFAERGLVEMDMASDTEGISAELQEKMKKALMAVQQVSQFANERDAVATHLESQPKHMKDYTKQKDSRARANDNSSDRRNVSDEQKEIDYADTLKLREVVNVETIVDQMGNFDAYRKYNNANQEVRYRSMLKELENQLQLGTTNCDLLNGCITQIVSNSNQNQNQNHHQARNRQQNVISNQQLKEIQSFAQKIIAVMNEIVTELSDAEHYIHSDHKKVEILTQQLKELENTMPYFDTKKLAILGTIPKFLNLEIKRLEKQRPKRIRSTAQEFDELNQMNKRRHQTFDWSVETITNLGLKTLEKTVVVKENLRQNLEQATSDPKLFATYLQQIDIAMDQISEYTNSLQQEISIMKEFVHPSHLALINCVSDLINTQIEFADLSKRYSLLEGEFNAAKEELSKKPKQMFVMQQQPQNKGWQQPVIGKPNQKESVMMSFDDEDLDFMQFAGNDTNNMNKKKQNVKNDGNKNENMFSTAAAIENIVPGMTNKLLRLKTKAAAMQRTLKDATRSISQLQASKSAAWAHSHPTVHQPLETNLYNNENGADSTHIIQQALLQLKEISSCVNEFDQDMENAQKIIGPDATYICNLERRYQQIYGLFQMKMAEVEHHRDLLLVREQEVDRLREAIDDLNIRLGLVMSSAMSNTETRLRAFNEQGIKIQTFDKVVKLIEDTYINVQQACEDIQESVEKDLFEILGDACNQKQQRDLQTMNENVSHACEYVLKAFDDIGQEMDGVRQFVHPDREMVEQLQTQILQLYQQIEDDENNNNALVPKADGDANTSSSNMRIILGSKDDSIINPRRRSIAQFADAFEKADKENVEQKSHGEDAMREEVTRRKSRSARRRRSSLSGINSASLLPPESSLKASSWTGAISSDPIDDEDRNLLKSLRNWVLPQKIARNDYTPATSPEQRPDTQPGINNEDDNGAFKLDVVGDERLYNMEDARERERERERISSKEASAESAARDGHDAEIWEQMKQQMENELTELKKTLVNKDDLISDLQRQMDALRDNRTAEIESVQRSVTKLRQRCRHWYDQLLYRVRETEKAYRKKLLKHEEIREQMAVENNKLLKNKQIENESLNRDRERERHRNLNEIDFQLHEEIKRENARLNEDLERYKQKYFDAEQKKIELQDQIEEKNEECQKMELSLQESVQSCRNFYEQIEQLKMKNQELNEKKNVLENQLQNQQNTNNASENTDNNTYKMEVLEEQITNLNTDKQELENKLSQQQHDYEEEFREFERMANEKVVQLEEYYMQQIRIKEIELQQLEQKLQNLPAGDNANANVNANQSPNQHSVEIPKSQQQDGFINGMMESISHPNLQMLQKQSEHLNAVQVELEQTQSELLEAKGESAKLNEVIVTLKESNKRLDDHLNHIKTRYSTMDEDNKRLKLLNLENENKNSAYKESFLDLAQKLKDLMAESTKLRKKIEKWKKKNARLEKDKKKLKTTNKALQEKIENITAVTTELVAVKNIFKQQENEWQEEKKEFEDRLNQLKLENNRVAMMKVDSINKYAIEFNNLRGIIRKLTGEIQYLRTQNLKLRGVNGVGSIDDDDNQSLLQQSIKYFSPSTWFR